MKLQNDLSRGWILENPTYLKQKKQMTNKGYSPVWCFRGPLFQNEGGMDTEEFYLHATREEAKEVVLRYFHSENGDGFPDVGVAYVPSHLVERVREMRKTIDEDVDEREVGKVLSANPDSEDQLDPPEDDPFFTERRGSIVWLI